MCVQGPPGAPTIIGINLVDTRAIILLWRAGLHGGLDQLIHFQTSSNNQVWTEKTTVTVLANEPSSLQNITITDLVGTQLYLRMFASNAWGISDMSEIWNITLQGV